MKISKVNLVYFSATYTTRKIVRAIVAEFGIDVAEYDITQSAPETEVIFGSDELLIVGMPVYAGRIPAGMAVVKAFAKETAALLAGVKDLNALKEVEVKGNRPYKIPGKIPLRPYGDKKCDNCGTCVKLCPTQAIPADSPRKTDKAKCISCGRCIVVCPQKARHFGRLIYKIAGKKFVKDFGGTRKEPETVFAEPIR